MGHLLLLIGLKLTFIKNALKNLRKKSFLELATLFAFLTLATIGLFLLFFYSFRFFQQQEPFGPVLTDEILYLFNFTVFLMLLISSGVSSYASLYRSGEVPFLITRPATWTEIYFIKLFESIWFSSWALLFLIVPFMAGYAMTHPVGWGFPLLCLAFYIPFVVLTGTLGVLISTITVWLLPSKGRRQIALLVVVTAVIYGFIKTSPEFIKEQGSLAGILSGYLPHVGFAKNGFLPSYWLTHGILSISETGAQARMSFPEGVFYFLLLFSNTLFLFIPSYAVAGWLYSSSYLRAQDFGEAKKTKRVLIRSGFEKLLDQLPWPSKPAKAFMEKDIKTFARDPSEWSQLIIFFGLLIIYFSNLRNLEFHILKAFWKNIIFVLNTIGTYIVLSSFSMRFIYPMLSLEGTRAWIIGLAPIRFASILLVKFFLGTVVSLILTLPLVLFSGWMLEIPSGRVLFTAGLGFFVCIALTGLSVGFGARFPNFKSNNPAEIISGFGGSMLLLTHLSYLGLIGCFLMLSDKSDWLILFTVAAGSFLIGMLPIKVGIRALEKMEF